MAARTTKASSTLEDAEKNEAQTQGDNAKATETKEADTKTAEEVEAKKDMISEAEAKSGDKNVDPAPNVTVVAAPVQASQQIDPDTVEPPLINGTEAFVYTEDGRFGQIRQIDTSS